MTRRVIKHIDQPSLQISIDPDTVFVSTDPNQSSYANLKISIKNTGANAIAVNSVAITLPPALAPTDNLNSVIPVASQPEIWSFGPSQINTGEFDAISVNGQNVNIATDETIAFELQMVTLTNAISQPSADVTVAITLADGSIATVPLNVNIDLAVASVSFVSEPGDINSGESATLSWNCEKIDYCIISPVSSNRLRPSGTMQVAPQSTTAYTLFAYGDGIILSAQRTVSVDNPQIIYFVGINGQTSVNYGDNITLVWECNQFTKSVTLTNDGGVTIPPLNENGNTPAKGSITVGPIIDPVTFAFNAYGNRGENPDQRNTLIMINDVSCNFTASPGSGIWTKDNVTLQWDIQSVSAVSISPPIANGPSLQNLSGSAIINPAADITYVISASGYINDQPVSDQQYALPLSVEQVAINSFYLDQNPLVPGFTPNQSTLIWNVQGLTVSIDNGIGTQPLVGRIVLTAPPDGTVYTLTAGTNLNPAITTGQAVIKNDYGPFTFNAINNGAPDSAGSINIILTIPDSLAMRDFPVNPAGGFMVNLTGVVPTGDASAGYSAVVFFNIQQQPAKWVFEIMGSTSTVTALNWADPNNPTGTVTIIETLY